MAGQQHFFSEEYVNQEINWLTKLERVRMNGANGFAALQIGQHVKENLTDLRTPFLFQYGCDDGMATLVKKPAGVVDQFRKATAVAEGTYIDYPKGRHALIMDPKFSKDVLAEDLKWVENVLRQR